MGVYFGGPTFATQGPAPDGFHVPLNTDWQAVYNVWAALGGGSSDGTNFGIALKLPFAGYRDRSDAVAYIQGSYGFYWSSSRSNENYAYSLDIGSSELSPQDSIQRRANGFSVRCFKNSPVIPTSSWTKLYGTSIESGGIFWSSTDGIISLSSDGQTWITISDKNLGATAVWNSGDTLSEANCGKYYQRGNNYGFPRTGTIANQSTTQVDASNYGPGNYYSSDTFIKYNGRWDSTDNGNLWGGVDGNVQMQKELQNAYIGESQREPGTNTIAYFPLETNWTDTVGGYTISNSGTFTTLDGVKCLYLNSQSCRCTSFRTFSSSDNFTVNCWVFNAGGGNYRIWCMGTAGDKYLGSIEYYYSGADRNLQYNWTGNYLRYGNSTATSAKWHNIVIVRNNGNLKGYIDGVEYSIGTDTGYMDTGYSALTLGALYWNSNNKLVGYLSKFIVDGVAWSSTEVSRYYNQTKGNYGIS